MNSFLIRNFTVSMKSVLFLLCIQCLSLQAQDSVRIAIFKGNGVGKSVDSLERSLRLDNSNNVEIERITPDEIKSGELKNIDILVHPGGSGSGQGKALGEEGRKAVREFVQQGGGYLGVCAGSYLATNDYSWSLNLIDAKVVDRKHWARGTGTVSLKLSPVGTKFFRQDQGEVDIYYGQGPLLGRPEWDDAEVPDYESLAIYDSEIAEKGAPQGIMQGTSAIVRTEYGDGRVFCFSPHPEKTENCDFMITSAVEWLLARRENLK